MTKKTQINCLNAKKVVNETYMHDFVAEGFQFDWFEKVLSFSAVNRYLGVNYMFLFRDVKYLSVQADEKWGGSGGVLHLWQVQDNNENRSWSDVSAGQFAVEFLFTSGDTMLIVADSAEIEENSLE